MAKNALSVLAGIAIGMSCTLLAANNWNSPSTPGRPNDAAKTVSIDTTELTKQVWDLPAVEVKEPF